MPHPNPSLRVRRSRSHRSPHHLEPAGKPTQMLLKPTGRSSRHLSLTPTAWSSSTLGIHQMGDSMLLGSAPAFAIISSDASETHGSHRTASRVPPPSTSSTATVSASSNLRRRLAKLRALLPHRPRCKIPHAPRSQRILRRHSHNPHPHLFPNHSDPRRPPPLTHSRKKNLLTSPFRSTFPFSIFRSVSPILANPTTRVIYIYIYIYIYIHTHTHTHTHIYIYIYIYIYI